MSLWDQPQSDNAHMLNGSDPTRQIVTLLIVAEAQRAQGLYAAFVGDARFQVLATATSPDDARAKLAMQPDAVIVEATAFSGPDEFAQLFATYAAALFVLLPENLPPSNVDAIRALPCVQQTIIGEANFATLTGQVFETVSVQRQARQAVALCGVARSWRHHRGLARRCYLVAPGRGGQVDHCDGVGL